MRTVSAEAIGREAGVYLLQPGGCPEPGVDAVAGPVFSRSKEGLRLRLYATLFVVDVLCIVGAFLLAGALRLGSPLEDQTLRTLAVVLPTFVAVAINNRAYGIASLRSPGSGAMKVAEALSYAIVVAIVLLFFFKVSADFSRAIFAAGTLLSLAAVVGGRTIVGKHVGHKHQWTFANQLVLVDGVPVRTEAGEAVIQAHDLGLEPRENDPVFLDRLSRLLEGCERVVVACPPPRGRVWSQALKGMALDVEILMPELTCMRATALGSFHNETTLRVSSGPLGLRDRALKRTLDVATASTALLILALLMALVAIAVRLESRGPVFFKQQRVGQNNRIFDLLKFRSMRAECTDAAGVRSACPDDDRLTRVGKFLRRTSLDELPQLYNVLIGDMSIVGPRPHALGSTAENSLFWHIDRRYFHRHAIKPGITGLAQIRGFRGATLRRDDLTNRLRSDLEYVSGWTILRDLRIMAATFSVLVHRNAF